MTDLDLSPLFLKECPLPPSSNQQYKMITVKGKPRFAASKELNEYKSFMKGYYYAHMLDIRAAQRRAQLWLLKGAYLNVRLHCYFKCERMYCKDGKPKRIDVSNRIKSSNDCLSDWLEIDDCYFFDVSAIKRVVPADSNEYANFEISPYF